MTLSPAVVAARARRIARPSGALAMVAMDQRESLRAMLAAGGRAVDDDALVDFKLAVAEVLSPHASAMLLDRPWGARAMQRLDPRCGRIVAADALLQDPGEAVRDTFLDDDIVPDRERGGGAAALKLLVVWRRDAERERRIAMTRAFVARCHEAELLAIVEGVVRSSDEDLLLEAARELAACGPDLYKAEVPLFGAAPDAELGRRAERLSRTLDLPWVVLSSGVPIDEFPRAVEAACRGGAAGFLAGRAIWADAVGPGDPRPRLRGTAVARLERLGEVVDRAARRFA